MASPRLSSACRPRSRRRQRRWAAECGPDKLGTSRVAEVGTKGGLLVGLKTYPAAIPLADHEVILTFDDGPDERTTPLVLKALADQCVRATFFAIGYKLDAQPALARREVEEGHNVANHTYTHPQPTLTFMPELGGARRHPEGHDRRRARRLRPGLFRRRADRPRQAQAARAVLPLPRLRRHRRSSQLVRRQQRRDLRHGSVGVGLDPDEARRGAEADPRPAGEGRARHAAVPRQPPVDGRDDAGLSRRAEEARLSRRPCRRRPGNGPTVPAPAGWVSETGRVTGAIKPRLDKTAAPRPPGPFAVKPAPAE